MRTTISHREDEEIPASELRNAILKMEDLLGRSMTHHIVEELESRGIELSNKSQSYSLHEIREGLDAIFGKETAELLSERIRKTLW